MYIENFVMKNREGDRTHLKRKWIKSSPFKKGLFKYSLIIQIGFDHWNFEKGLFKLIKNFVLALYIKKFK